MFWNIWSDLEFEHTWELEYLDIACRFVEAHGWLLAGFFGSALSRILRKVDNMAKILGMPVDMLSNMGCDDPGIVFVWQRLPSKPWRFAVPSRAI